MNNSNVVEYLDATPLIRGPRKISMEECNRILEKLDALIGRQGNLSSLVRTPKDAAITMDLVIKGICDKNHVDYVAAFKILCKENPELVKAYQDFIWKEK